jgi:hypothetical protein
MQYRLCEKIVAEPYQKKEKDFDPDHFSFRGTDYDLFDVWGLACDRLLNKKGYKEMCFEGSMLTNSGDYFILVIPWNKAVFPTPTTILL